jgi:hypothetical protein
VANNSSHTGNTTFSPEFNTSISLTTAHRNETSNGTKLLVIPILVELTGELGNNLHHLAHGLALQVMLARRGISTKVIPQRLAKGEKYFKTQKQLKQCFPNLKPVKFYTNGLDTKKPKQLQESWLGKELVSRLKLKSGSTLDTTRQTVEAVHSILQNTHLLETRPSNASSSSILSVPFIHTSSMINREFMDQFYDDIRAFFEFNETACCPQDLVDKEAIFVSNFISSTCIHILGRQESVHFMYFSSFIPFLVAFSKLCRRAPSKGKEDQIGRIEPQQDGNGIVWKRKL